MRTVICRVVAPLAAAVVVLAQPSGAEAQLRPDQVAVIAMRRSADSRRVAEHYVKARGIPANHICLLDEPIQKPLPREVWDAQTRPFLRRWLVEQGLESKIRCMVCVYDVPLLIDRRDPATPGIAERRDYLRIERNRKCDQIRELIRAAETLAGPGVKPDPIPGPDARADALSKRFEAAFKHAQQSALAKKDEPTGKQAAAILDRIFLANLGVGGMLRALGQAGDGKPEWQNRLDIHKGTFQGISLGMQALDSLPDSVERDQQILNLLQQSEGLIGALAWIDAQLVLLEANESYASFDSELSLLYWPPYPLLRWQPNVLFHAYDGNPVQQIRYTLMVARLEAPTVALTMGLVDKAIETEKSGLTGKVYLDARGLRADPVRGSTGDFDESLRALANLLKEKTKLDVVLNDKAEVFAPGSCPDAAIYCGWYSLANYVDAFRWRPGAVGYHLASSEATTLRDPASTVWCKRMLEEGVAATLGPVREPFLVAFPRPDEFFAALLTGKWTLVECFYRTSPFNSWVMILVGDPLYRPYAKNPPLRVEDLPLNLRAVFGPQAPSGAPKG